MKKTIGILILALFSTTVFGQLVHFDRESVVISEHQGIIRSGGFKGVSDFYYNFETNNKKYILAYNADENDWKRGKKDVRDPELTRELILYRFDGVDNWVKASNVVQVDYEDSEPEIDYGTHIGYGIRESKLITRGLGSGCVKILESGCVIMVLTNKYTKPDRVYSYSRETDTYSYNGHKVDKIDIYTENSSYDYNAVVIFVPNGNKTYTATRFEPKDKRNKDFSPNIKITEIGDKIMIDIPTYHQTNDKSTADTCVVYQGEREKGTVCYNKKKYATLLFEIQPDNTVKVLASGKLDLIEKL
ncbi:MAG: hypothetical protein PF487_12190 [Bacteroidales bacterium]|jgi:hypothetical protein|nr:hypothetical protein [Bacteroidales bacterium]